MMGHLDKVVTELCGAAVAKLMAIIHHRVSFVRGFVYFLWGYRLILFVKLGH